METGAWCWPPRGLIFARSMVMASARARSFPQSDVEYDFLRARRRQVAARLAALLRHKPDSASRLLSLSEVTGALGDRGERRLGLQSIPLATIVGTLDARRDFDNQFRPTPTASGTDGNGSH
jgi:hypothetical protein